ncbi:TRAP dicarboxylate transporter subunit DctQ [Marinobacterium aestuarii]|uniref:TRAP transporter small permease protein n=1 Tax=Marinobacterium aestuarii TaxID=1821621 RepID=A0A1A9F4M5_9GAMM|nr:TRAP transporter small permease [Marinobacterium aestuarii]ANG64663.1 TRAP dicarboxylate transporter subunit DctQ [Marinobacterium aestuarii]
MTQALAKMLTGVARILLYCGGIIVLIQATWISYGVFMRYVMNNPDGVVTEATALLLVPVAFFGLAYALHMDAYPKVTIFRDLMPVKLQGWVDRFNLLIMTLTGAFFALAACRATLHSFSSGAASEILLWPRFYFWVPVAISLVVFVLTAAVMLLRYQHPTAQETQ